LKRKVLALSAFVLIAQASPAHCTSTKQTKADAIRTELARKNSLINSLWNRLLVGESKLSYGIDLPISTFPPVVLPQPAKASDLVVPAPMQVIRFVTGYQQEGDAVDVVLPSHRPVPSTAATRKLLPGGSASDSARLVVECARDLGIPAQSIGDTVYIEKLANVSYQVRSSGYMADFSATLPGDAVLSLSSNPTPDQIARVHRRFLALDSVISQLKARLSAVDARVAALKPVASEQSGKAQQGSANAVGDAYLDNLITVITFYRGYAKPGDSVEVYADNSKGPNGRRQARRDLPVGATPEDAARLMADCAHELKIPARADGPTVYLKVVPDSNPSWMENSATVKLIKGKM